MARVGIAEAAHNLGISQDTVRRRLRCGELAGEKVRHAGGFRWLVEMDNTTTAEEDQRVLPSGNGTDTPLIASLEARIDDLKEELEARRQEIQQLHILLSQRALESPSASRWWRFWGR